MVQAVVDNVESLRIEAMLNQQLTSPVAEEEQFVRQTVKHESQPELQFRFIAVDAMRPEVDSRSHDSRDQRRQPCGKHAKITVKDDRRISAEQRACDHAQLPDKRRSVGQEWKIDVGSSHESNSPGRVREVLRTEDF